MNFKDYTAKERETHLNFDHSEHLVYLHTTHEATQRNWLKRLKKSGTPFKVDGDTLIVEERYMRKPYSVVKIRKQSGDASSAAIWPF